MNYLKFDKFDTANGPGLRGTFYVSGCVHECAGCFNPESWDYRAGKEFTSKTKEEILDFFIENKNTLSGLSLLGGDPFCQDFFGTSELVSLCEQIKEINPNFTVWAWTGYTIDQIRDHLLLPVVDVLVDGKFEEDKKDLTLKWMGSSNQKIYYRNKEDWME